MPSSADSLMTGHTILALVEHGGIAMYPLVLCSVLIWCIILERFWHYMRLGQGLKAFHLEAMNTLLRNDLETLRNLCQRSSQLPTARLLLVAFDRWTAKDHRLRGGWAEALERQRLLMNAELRRNLWLLGTIGSAAPFIGLFGTVLGILRSFQEMASTGSGGFAVVAAGISESLVATAAGIVVAVIAVMAFNTFQTWWGHLVLLIRIQMEELTEILAVEFEASQSKSQP